ncbi:hypothetical protein [Moorena bouillonii]|uniref:hypothetical protein n=1 Tax=Moorena bouillonii TaxID=207920 RepID=UPI00117C2765|nr:hypothetical protein [Moorena bouillonii]
MAYGLSFRAYAIDRRSRYANAATTKVKLGYLPVADNGALNIIRKLFPKAFVEGIGVLLLVPVEVLMYQG